MEVNELNQFAIRAALAALVFTGAPLAIVAAHETALTRVAADLGFVYSYLGPEDAVSLTRPGVTVVIRPGERLFDVNDRTEAMDGAAPHFSHSDIFVSDALVARLRQIALRYPYAASAARTLPIGGLAVAADTTPVTGAITALSVSQVAGQQEIAVGGKAPANLPITLTLVSTFSVELPDVVLSRHEVTVDADGTFKTNVTIASGYFRGSILTLVATSLPGISSAKTQIVMKAPNDSVSIPADQSPSSIR
jgi:hypothetical protein